ncbi:MAG: hypothetical protein GF320_11585 [Armatimonadia bacterium]|nr:hypothetical protein [Armatimonadia bacterium]
MAALLALTHALLLAQPAEPLSPAEALTTLAGENDLSLLAIDLPQEPAFTGSTDELWPALWALEAECGIEATVWRGMLLARPKLPGTTSERIRGALSEEDEGLLFRDIPRYRTMGWPDEWWSVVAACLREMVLHPKAEGTRELQQRAALWMAARDLQLTLRLSDGLELGTAGVQLWEQGGLDGGPVVAVEVPREDRFDTLGPVFERIFGLAYPLPESVWSADGGMIESGPASAPAQDVTRALPGVTVSGESDPVDRWRALALLTGQHLTWTPGEPVLEPPACHLEAIIAALPLDAAALSTLSSAERESERAARADAFWVSLPASDRSVLTQERCTEGDTEAWPAIEWALQPQWAGQLTTRVLNCLPERDGPVPLWVHHLSGEDGWYRLSSPALAEEFRGAAYYAIREEVGVQ